jgi:hypothetical protein
MDLSSFCSNDTRYQAWAERPPAQELTRMWHSMDRKDCPMTNEKRKFTETLIACPPLLVSMVWISEGTCMQTDSLNKMSHLDAFKGPVPAITDYSNAIL